MKVFTYSQYIKCIHTLRLNAVLQLAEESAEYKLNEQKKKDSYDKLVKNILKDTKKVAELINQFLEPREKVEEENLIRYTNNVIIRKYKEKENLIYKLKNQDAFFLIEYQSAIDTSIQYKILNYCIDIIQEWCKEKKQERTYGYPIVVPIVIYTGDQKWKIPKEIKEKQISTYVFERYKIDLEYNVIDINKISKQSLYEKDSIFSDIMLIKKSKNKEELIENLENIIKFSKKIENLEELSSIVNSSLNNLLEKNIQEELIEKITKKIEKNEYI